MSRQTEREIARLNKLADFIEANPKEYNQGDKTKCILGLGQRLYRGKLKPYVEQSDKFEGYGRGQKEFSKKFGVTFKTATNLFIACFGSINPKAKNQDCFGDVPTRSAVSILRYIAKQKALDKVV